MEQYLPALSPAQQKVYAFLKQYILEYRQSPTIKQICSGTGSKWPNAVYKTLTVLERKGYVTRRKNSKRNIELRSVDTFGEIKPTVSIPIVASVGCDDLSVLAREEHDEFLEVDKGMVREGSTVAVRAVGESMNDSGINNGDYVLIELTDDVKNGERVAAIIGDMVTVKKLERRSDMVILRPESTNPKYKPIILRENFKVAGRVIGVVPNPKEILTEVQYDNPNHDVRS